MVKYPSGSLVHFPSDVELLPPSVPEPMKGGATSPAGGVMAGSTGKVTQVGGVGGSSLVGRNSLEGLPDRGTQEDWSGMFGVGPTPQTEPWKKAEGRSWSLVSPPHVHEPQQH